MDRNWLLGFIEGEGCFTVTLIKSKTHPGGYQIRPAFIIKITKSERDVLERIKHHLGGIGHIYDESSEGNRKKKMLNANDSVSLRVTKLSELKKIIEMFDAMRFESDAKRSDFNNWVKCVELVSKGEHKTKEGILKIAKIREKIHKRKQWNKKSYCDLRSEIDPCEIYKKNKKIPKNCKICLK